MGELFTIRRGTKEDADAVFRLMQSVKETMECPEWYVTDTKEYVERHMDDHGMTFLAEVQDGTLAGYFIVDFPAVRLREEEDEENDNLGKELKMDEKNLALVAHMDSAAVDSRYRGCHLQHRLLQAAEQSLQNTPYEHYLCTIHPDNHASLHTMQRSGYVIVATKEKYQGLKRHVLYKKRERIRPNVLVSACLLGVTCRYNEKGELNKELESLMEIANLIPICPESIGGLATPRVPAERVGNRVVTKTGADVTKEYQKGAEIAWYLASFYHCSCAVLKERSPSCGSGTIYDGTHTGTLTAGDGVTAECLKNHGILVFGESQITKCRTFLEKTL